MDYKYIEQLLSRYFEATSTLKEEEILKAFFAQEGEEVPVGLRHYKDLFAAMEPGEGLTSGFDERILSLTVNKTETEGADSNADDETVVRARTISLSERLQPVLRAAAAVAIFLTISTAVNQSFMPDNVWTDEEQMAEYQKAMRDATIAANSDSTLLYTEGIGLKGNDSIVVADTIYGASPTGYIE